MKTFTTLVLTGALALVSTSSAESPASLGLQRLMEGNARFAAGKAQHPHQDAARKTENATGQKPFAIVIGCSDSRTSPELLFDQGLGDIFVVRVAGNTVNPAALASIEFAVTNLGSKLIVVLGHEKCGAVNAALVEVKGNAAPSNLSAIIDPIKPSAANVQGQAGDELNNAVNANIQGTVAHLSKASPVLGALLQRGEITIIGARYDLDNGKVELLP